MTLKSSSEINDFKFIYSHGNSVIASVSKFLINLHVTMMSRKLSSHHMPVFCLEVIA